MTIQVINPYDNTNVVVDFSTFPGGEEHVRIAQNNLRHVRVQGGAEYVKLKAIEKWNGALPQVAGDTGGLILNLK